MERTLGAIAILYPVTQEIHQSELIDHDGRQQREADIAFSDATESVFDLLGLDDDSPRLKQTGIFLDRFFGRMNYRDLADKYETTPGGVSKLYDNARRRLIKSIEVMDRADLAKANGDRLATLPKWLQVFMLHAVFGMANNEIQQVLGISHHSLVSKYIRQTNERIAAGKIQLADVVGVDAGGGKSRKTPKTGAEYYREAMDLICSGRVNNRRQAVEILSEKEGVDVEKIEGAISGYVTGSEG